MCCAVLATPNLAVGPMNGPRSAFRYSPRQRPADQTIVPQSYVATEPSVDCGAPYMVVLRPVYGRSAARGERPVLHRSSHESDTQDKPSRGV